MANDKAGENLQYQPVEHYLKTAARCTVTRRVGQKPIIRLDVREPNSRTPDVAGARRAAGQWETFIVEAKRDVGGGAAIQLGLAQLSSVRHWADYLYLSLALADWKKRLNEGATNIRAELQERGFGLMLVAGKAVSVELDAVKNEKVEPAKRDELLTGLGIDPKLTWKCAETLSTSDARMAARTLQVTMACLEAVRPVWNQILHQHVRESFDYLDTDVSPDNGYAVIWSKLDHGPFYVEADPFGYYLQDGAPALWLWCRTDATAISNESFRGRGEWFFYALTEDSAHEDIRRLPDADLAEMKSRGFWQERHIARRFPIGGATVEEVRSQFREALEFAASTRVKQDARLAKANGWKDGRWQ